jgi:hypothetical protein
MRVKRSDTAPAREKRERSRPNRNAHGTAVNAISAA